MDKAAQEIRNLVFGLQNCKAAGILPQGSVPPACKMPEKILETVVRVKMKPAND